MKDSNDQYTVDIYGFLTPVPKRGRPVTGQARTNAERQKAYRQRLKSIQKTVTVTKNQPDEIDWQARAVELKAENDYLRRSLQDLIDLNNRQTQRFESELRSAVTPLKTQVTKYRNENQSLRDKIQHLEFMASAGKS